MRGIPGEPRIGGIDSRTEGMFQGIKG
jgi:hypothetical protein